MPNQPLSGLHVMVTRPPGLAENLCRKLQEAGAKVTHFPCVAITDVTDNPELIPLFRDRNRFRAMIFISRNAVIYAYKLLHQLNIPLPECQIFAVGAGTAEQLRAQGVTDLGYPRNGAGSEALVKQGLLAGLRSGEVLIVRGQGGNEQLYEVLTAQGVRVSYAEVYKREKPKPVRSFTDDPPQLILLTSTESLQNLYELTEPPPRAHVLGTQLIVGNSDMVAFANRLGFRRAAIVADSPTDADMLKAVLNWVQI